MPPMLHRHRMEVDPNGRDPTAPATDRKCFAWAQFKSPTTHVQGNNSRSIVWAPGHLYERARRFCASWWWLNRQGDKPGRLLNFHTHPVFGGWTQPENPHGVSPIAIDYFGGNVYDGVDGLMLTLQPHAKRGRYHFPLASHAEVLAARANGRGFSIALDIEISDVFAAAVKGWVNGRLAFSLTGIRTVFPGMTGVALWEGSYNSSGVPELQVNEFLPCRIGRDPLECISDLPVEVGTWGSVARANGQAAHRHVTVGQEDASVIAIPAEWLGTVPPPDPAPAVTSTVENGDTVEKGALWAVMVTPTPGKVEFWANGEKFDEDTSAPFQTTIPLDAGPHQLGLAITTSGRRVTLGPGGVFADVSVIEPVPTPPLGLPLRVLGQGATHIDIGWDAVEGARGFRFTREQAAGKASHTWDGARTKARFANDSAWYEVEALGTMTKGVLRSVTEAPA